MVGMGRISVQGIDEEMWNEFKENVIARYGKLHTVLGLEVEKALRAYMGEYPQRGDTHTHQKQEEKTEQKKESKEKIPKGIAVGKTRAERINNVGELLMGGAAGITDTGIRRFIATQGVGDDRVIESYIQTMKLKGWLEIREKDAGLSVLRSTISKALDIQLPRETLEKMVESYKMPQVEGNGGRH